MRKTITGLVLAASVVLGGCATLDGLISDGKSVLSGGTSITASIQNPIGRRELAAIENTYGLALSAAVAYRRLPLCRTGQVETLNNVCARRPVIVQLQVTDRRVRVALVNLRKFVRNNDTINAVTAFNAAKAAIEDFRAVAASNGVM